MSDVIIYSRQFCGYCSAAKRLLADKGAIAQDLLAPIEGLEIGENLDTALGEPKQLDLL